MDGVLNGVFMALKMKLENAQCSDPYFKHIDSFLNVEFAVFSKNDPIRRE